jgi:EAL domain-containing protein (putative c-di-GMP-specific phosphodiesterase class I)/anti-sigma regulatory factor (Ser/Thr protein kinase)
MRLAPPRFSRDARPFDRQPRIAELPFALIPISLGVIAALLLAFILINRDHNRANHDALVNVEAKEQTLDRLIARVGNMDRTTLTSNLTSSQKYSLDAAVDHLSRLGSHASVTIVGARGRLLYSSTPDAPFSTRLNGTENAVLAGRGASVVPSGGSGEASVSYVGLPVVAPAPAAILEIRRTGDAGLPASTLDWRQILLCLGLGLLVWAIIRPFVTREARARAAHLYRARPGLVRAINRGIARGEFELHYQPQIDAQSGKPVAVEALLRWRRKGEIVMPGDYLPDAEASGAIVPLTHHILGMAVAQAQKWHQGGLPIRVSVNLSAASLTNLEVVERLRELIAAHELPRGALTTEVTETAVLDEPEQARAVLDAITELGVDVAVDDFGTGYASLLWLRLFPVSEVKIDRTFVASMEEDGEAFVAGVIRMGHDLGVRVVGEGIEDDVTLGRLQELGCDIAQGFLFAKPMPADEIPGWFEDEAHRAWAPRREEMEFGEGELELGKARSMIERTATSLGYDDEEIWDLKLAATEAVTNALDHGEAPDDGLVHLRVGTQRSEILIEVWGGLQNGKKANGGASTGGRGIAIISALVDDVELTRKAGSTMVRLSKRPRVRVEAHS